MVEDYLALPGDRPAAEKIAEPVKRTAVSRPRSGRSLAPKKDSYADRWRRLTSKQRLYLEQLQKAGFNKGRALRACRHMGHEVERHRPLRWKASDKNYAWVFQQMVDAELGEAVNPANMLLKADEILEMAMEGTSVYGPGGVLLGVEPQLDTALRANEQKMKATGLMRVGEANTRVTVRLVNLAGAEGQAVIEAQAETVTPE